MDLRMLLKYAANGCLAKVIKLVQFLTNRNFYYKIKLYALFIIIILITIFFNVIKNF